MVYIILKPHRPMWGSPPLEVSSAHGSGLGTTRDSVRGAGLSVGQARSIPDTAKIDSCFAFYWYQVLSTWANSMFTAGAMHCCTGIRHGVESRTGKRQRTKNKKQKRYDNVPTQREEEHSSFLFQPSRLFAARKKPTENLFLEQVALAPTVVRVSIPEITALRSIHRAPVLSGTAPTPPPLATSP